MFLQIAGILELVSSYRRLQGIRANRSILDVSVDTCILDIVDYASSLLYYFFYTSHLVKIQFKVRMPDLPMILWPSLMIIEVLKLAVASATLWYFSVFVLTKKRYQRWSEVCRFMVAANLVVFLAVSWAIHQDKLGLKFIDSIDYIWFAGQQAKVGKFWPQMMLNIEREGGPKGSYMALKTQKNEEPQIKTGPPLAERKYLYIQLAGLVLGFFSKLALVLSVRWYEVPLNCYTFVYYLVNIPTVVFLVYQTGERTQAPV